MFRAGWVYYEADAGNHVEMEPAQSTVQGHGLRRQAQTPPRYSTTELNGAMTPAA